MNNKGQLGIGGIVILFVGIVFIFALIGVIFDTQAEMTTKQETDNQSNDVSSAYLSATTVNTTLDLTIYEQSIWKQAECPLESVVLRNGPGTTLVANTDYTLDEDAGTYVLIDTAATQPGTSLNLTYADFTFCGDGYNTNSGSRSIAGLIGLFSTLALLGFVLHRSGVMELAKGFS